MLVKLKALIILILITICSSGSLAAYNVHPDNDDGVSYEKLRKLIVSNKTRTLEDALALLPKPFFEGYVLVYRSRSLQDSSFLFPRAIVFGSSARFIMSFNGQKKQRGYNNLEIIQFREETRRWEFREITFLEGSAPEFSEANPKKCLECHQSPKRTDIDPRPNWEPYNLWPGVYGSADDTIGPIDPVFKMDYDSYYEEYKETGRFPYGPLAKFKEQDLILIDEQAQEQTRLREFLSKVKPNHQRYKYLGEMSIRGPLSLTKLTVIHNMKRVVRLIKEGLGELFHIYKYALFGLGDGFSFSSKELKFNCAKLYMPKIVLEKHEHLARKSPNYLLAIKKKAKEGFSESLELIVAPLGMMTDDWSMDFKTGGRFSFDDRYSSPANALADFREAMEVLYKDDPVVQMGCEELKMKSEEALSEFNASGGLDIILNQVKTRVPSKRKPLINRCISCHVKNETGEMAPWIPFDNFKSLKPRLSAKKYKRGTLMDEIRYRTSDHAPLREQMPPAGVVDSVDRQEFIHNLEQLMAPKQ